jgi:2'-5' RNA ligase
LIHCNSFHFQRKKAKESGWYLLELTPASEYWNLIANSLESPLLGLVFRLPPRLHRPVSLIQNELKQVDNRQLFAKPSTLHITVKGFGLIGRGIDIEKQRLILLRSREMISEFSTFQIRLKGLSYFPTSVYIKVEDPLDQFRMINKRLIAELGGLVEKSQYDGDLFIPHVTIATFNTIDCDDLISKLKSEEMQEKDLGPLEVLELEAVEARMFLLLGPEESQDEGLVNLRSFPLSSKKNHSTI